MSSFVELVDEFGHAILLTSTSPNLIGILLRQAVLRGLERDVATKEGIKGRICFDIMKTAAHSKKVLARDRGCIRSVTTNALWTKTRALMHEYQLDSTLCSLCGQHPDTLLHRLWGCPMCQDTRLDIFGDKHSSMIDVAFAAAESYENILLYARGLSRHSGD